MKTPNKKMPDKNAQATRPSTRRGARQKSTECAIAALAAVEKAIAKPRLQGQLAIICRRPNLLRATATGVAAGDKLPVDLWKSGSRPSCARSARVCRKAGSARAAIPP